MPLHRGFVSFVSTPNDRTSGLVTLNPCIFPDAGGFVSFVSTLTDKTYGNSSAFCSLREVLAVLSTGSGQNLSDIQAQSAADIFNHLPEEVMAVLFDFGVSACLRLSSSWIRLNIESAEFKLSMIQLPFSIVSPPTAE